MISIVFISFPVLLLSFLTKKKFREYFDDIIALNSEINKREKDIEKMRKDEMKKYKRNQMNNKSNNTVEVEMSFAAMFGNGIFI